MQELAELPTPYSQMQLHQPPHAMNMLMKNIRRSQDHFDCTSYNQRMVQGKMKILLKNQS